MTQVILQIDKILMEGLCDKKSATNVDFFFNGRKNADLLLFIIYPRTAPKNVNLP